MGARRLSGLGSGYPVDYHNLLRWSVMIVNHYGIGRPPWKNAVDKHGTM